MKIRSLVNYSDPYWIEVHTPGTPETYRFHFCKMEEIGTNWYVEIVRHIAYAEFRNSWPADLSIGIH